MIAVGTVRIGNKEIGEGRPCFIIAEAGVNHNGNLEMACGLVDKSIEVGADAVKFQTFDPPKLTSTVGTLAKYQAEAGMKYDSQLEMLEKLKLTYDQFRKLAEYCKKKGQTFLSTPFEYGSLKFLLELGIPAVKLSSSDLTNHPYLAQVAKAGKPVILSTGMGDMKEIEAAVGTLKGNGAKEIIVMQCTSMYPAPPEALNVSAIRTLREKLGLPVGFSDHSEGHEADVLALAYGACVIEKHFTLDKKLPGPDHTSSLDPAEFKAMVEAVRTAEKMIGDGIKKQVGGEREIVGFSRKSIVFAKDLPAGHVLSAEDLAIKRPGNGLDPTHLPKVVGRTLKVAVQRDHLLKLSDLS